MKQRETFKSRLGFLLLSAGCAIGIGNVWRFPYVVGQNGGGAFVLFYVLFLAIMGVPVLSMEFAVGRASRKSPVKAYQQLEPKGSKWHFEKWFAMAGNYILMMFYTTVAGWLFLYFVKMAAGDFAGLDVDGVAGEFNAMLSNPSLMIGFMILCVVFCFSVCAMGLQGGVEKITKLMMVSLLVLMVVLAINSVRMEGSRPGLEFYLKPDFNKIKETGIGEVVFAALGQSFFTLSIGIGALAIFGSYIGKERRLTGEAINVTILDTFVAFMAGLIIFPACFAYNIEPGQGPSLIFITLPNVFNNMPGGRFWGTLFFLFMSFAAASTVIAVFQNIVSFATDLTGCSVKKAVVVNMIAVTLLSLPCVLGFNVWSNVTPFGPGSTILDLEDFIVSNNLLPLGSLVYLLFCTSRYGWGFKNFLGEANEGKGIKFPVWARVYVSYIIPVVVLYIFVQGYWSKFFA